MRRHSLLAFAAMFFVAVNSQRASLGGEPLRVCLISACTEYESEKSLIELQSLLEKNRGIDCFRVFGADKGTGLPGLDALNRADVMVVFARRVTLPEDQLALVKKFCESGRGIVGIRTASHAFQNWLAFDPEVLGGSYDGHWPKPEKSEVRSDASRSGHAVLAGVPAFFATDKLYKNARLSGDATLLLTARGPEHTEPAAWVRDTPKARVFYTSLGSREDFRDEAFLRLLLNAIFWSARREVPK